MSGTVGRVRSLHRFPVKSLLGAHLGMVACPGRIRVGDPVRLL